MLDEKFYTVADVARVTGLTSRTIRNYLKDGTLRGQKIGVQWRFTEDEVKKLFSRQTPGCSSPAQVVRGFLGQETQKGASFCVLLDVPGVSEEEGRRLYQQMEQTGQNGQAGITAMSYEYHDEGQLLRIAVSGEAEVVMDLLEEMKAGMKIG
jgi:excisionase family DNA binding protein